MTCGCASSRRTIIARPLASWPALIGGQTVTAVLVLGREYELRSSATVLVTTSGSSPLVEGGVPVGVSSPLRFTADTTRLAVSVPAAELGTVAVGLVGLADVKG